jgi:dihydroorotate dehydrogenase (NAD+) catalytic subunit
MTKLYLKNKTLKINLAGIEMNNPVMNASGTFGLANGQLIDLKKLGAIVGKTITLEPREGNLPPRLAETVGGMLNSIGLQNPGVEAYIREDLQEYLAIGIPVIVSVAGKTVDEYVEITKIMNDQPVSAIEINVSCPNVRDGGLSFGADEQILADVVKKCRKVCQKPLIVKLTPNVTDIAKMAQIAEKSGADAIALINNLLGMKIDIKSRSPYFANTYAGLSGPAIKPIALRMVHQVSQVVKIPIIGMGGITTADDAIEFLLAGADAVAIGTANFINPAIILEIIVGIKKYLKSYDE